MIQKKKHIISVTILAPLGILFLMGLLATCDKFEPEAELILRTESVEEVIRGEFKVTGRFINIGREEIEQHGFCWSPAPHPTVNDEATRLGGRKEAGMFSSTISGLPLDWQFYIRAYAITREDTTWGKDLVFVTPPPVVPLVNTGTLNSVTLHSAEISGDVVSDEGDPVTARGICWSTSPEPVISDNQVTAGTGTGGFTVTLTELNCSSTYYARAFAVNSAGPGYGEVVSFTTEPCIPEEGEFLFSDRDGIWRMAHTGERTLFASATSSQVEVQGNHVYVNYSSDISVYDLQGNLVRTVQVDDRISGYLCVLPEEHFAFLNNSTDTVSFANPDGDFITAVSMTGNEPDGTSQNLNGVVVNNQLIISEDGENHLIGIDLSNYERYIFRDFEHLTGWLSDIDYSNGTYYLCQSQKIFAFKNDENELLISTLPDYHNMGIAVLGDFGYIASNFGNKIYRINLRNGDYQVLVNDANYPKDIELIK
jgi:hypothetical protein